MRREFSAGGVVARRMRGRWYLAAIRPGGRSAWALPKGLVDHDEAPAQTAAREVTEETGVSGTLLEKLGDVRYVYTWEGERVFKIVSFFLFHYRSGRLGDISAAHRHEVDDVRWIPIADAAPILSYKGEREMAAKALARLDQLQIENPAASATRRDGEPGNSEARRRSKPPR